MKNTYIPNTEHTIYDFYQAVKESLSLNIMEKTRILESFFDSNLSTFQINELMKVFKEEKQKFTELAAEHPDDIIKLVRISSSDWLELCNTFQHLPQLPVESNEFLKLQQLSALSNH